MKMTHPLSALFMFGLVLTATAANQNLFLPNISTGANGEFTPTFASTGNTGLTNIVLPPDGRLNFTRVSIPANVTVKFLRNALNTPVYLLASGDVTILGTIDVSGETGTDLRGGFGGPGGFDGGTPRDNRAGSVPGDGYGPGAGSAVVGDFLTVLGRATYGTVLPVAIPPRDGQPYGSQLLMPLVGGSGGGGYSLGVGSSSGGGGGGGGAILIASSTIIAIPSGGRMLAWGGNPNGSGGAIRLLAPMIVGGAGGFGNGTLDVSGAASGGHGRIRCDLIDRSNFVLNFTPAEAPVTTDQFLPLTAPPSDAPRLRIVRVGNTLVPADAGYSILLSPLNAPLMQDVVIEASNFNGQARFTIKLTPLTGSSTSINTNINNPTFFAARITNSLPFPANVPVTVSVWTR